MDITQLGGPNRVRITLIEPLDVLRLGIESLLKSNYNYTVECYKSYKDFKKYSREIESFLLNVYLVHSIPFSVKKNEVLKYLDVFVPSHKTIFIIDDSTSIDCFEQNLDSIFDVIKLNQPTNDFVNCISTAMSTNKKSTLELKQKFISLMGFHTLKISHIENKIIQLLAYGNTNTQIGDILSRSPRTIEGHRNRLLSKTKSKNTAQLIAWAAKHNYV